MNLAFELIKKARECGADSVKFQLYDAHALFPRQGNKWFDYNCQTELTKKQVEMLAEECSRIGIDFFVSVFDLERIAWMEELGVKRYKIASRSVNDKALISALENTGKPLLISLGMWQEKHFPDIRTSASVDWLYCVSKYPTPLQDVHLRSVDFSVYSGFSDHTIGLTAAQAALARGARIIEKHFTLDKELFGPDHSCSMSPEELLTLARFRDELIECLS